MFKKKKINTQGIFEDISAFTYEDIGYDRWRRCESGGGASPGDLTATDGKVQERQEEKNWEKKKKKRCEDETEKTELFLVETWIVN